VAGKFSSQDAVRERGHFANNYPHGQTIPTQRATGSPAVKFAGFASLQKKTPTLQTRSAP
jgi:hypothetical protein